MYHYAIRMQQYTQVYMQSQIEKVKKVDAGLLHIQRIHDHKKPIHQLIIHSNNQTSEEKCMTITTAAFGILISPSVSQLYSYLCTGHENVGQYNHYNEISID